MKRILAFLVAAALAVSLTACGGGSDKGAASSKADKPAGSTAAAGSTSAEQKYIVLWYGSSYYDGIESRFYCPEGAVIDEDEYAEFEQDGYLLSYSVIDENRGYTAYTEAHQGREYYSEEPSFYSLTAQLYLYGELDEKNAEEYENCYQTVTDLGFRWEGREVKLLETYYTVPSYGEQVEQYVCVDLEYPYWRTDEETGAVQENLIAPGLFGFVMYSHGIEELTVDQCAWIAGQMFGVDSGRSWPLENDNTDPTPAPVVDVDVSEIYGTWIDPTSTWEDTFVFNPDGTGVLVSGPQYPYTYTVDGNILTLTYDDGEEESFEVSVDGENLVLVDRFGEELWLDPSDQEIVIEEKADYTEELIGYWLDEAAGNNESFTFNEDERGVYTWKDEVYEFDYFLDEDYLSIYYDDGDRSSFSISIEGDTMTLDGDWILFEVSCLCRML